jgi:autotransporter-associated beta strand protein
MKTEKPNNINAKTQRNQDSPRFLEKYIVSASAAFNPKKLWLLCASLSLCALASNSPAQVSGTYTGTNNWNWGTAANWTPAAVPDAAGATASFNAVTNSALAGKTIVLGGTRTIGTLNVTGGNGVNASGTLSIGSAGQLLSFNNGAGDGAVNLGGGITLRVLANVSASGNLQVNNASGVLGSVVLGGTTTITGTAKFNNADPYAGITVSGRLLAGGLSKDGSGSLILSGSGNVVTGNVAFNEGTIVVGNDNVLGSGTINLMGSGARRLNLLDATDRALGNAINLATVNLMVGREDGSTPTATTLRTLTINPATASVSALGSGTRTLTVDTLTGLAFGNNQSFSGGTLLKDGGGVLTLGGAASTFSKLQVEMGTVKGALTGNTTLGGGPSVFGAGNISVSGGNTVLEITGTDNADTLTIGANANISLSDYATFRLSGGGLALVGGTINLNNNGILDYGAGTVTLGNTAILGASAGGFNFGSNLIFTNNTGITNTGSFRYNLTNSGTQILSRDTAGAVTVSGTMIKTGAGNTVIDPSITSLTLTRGLQLDAGTLTFTAANQYPSSLTFTGNAATVSLGGFNQAIGGVTINAGASGIFALGGNPATSTQLALGTVTLGDTSSVLRVRDYTDGTLITGVADQVTTSSVLTAPQLSQVWFYGYNKGATLTGGELKPAGGLLDSTWAFLAGSYNWFDNNWLGGDEYNIPNSPGARAAFVSGYGSLDAKTINLGNRTVTLGELSISESSIVNYFYFNSGTVVFDSGVAGAPALSTGSRSRSFNSNTRIVLNSDLRIDGNYTALDGITSGSGKISVVNSGYVAFTNAVSAANTFTGGVEINNSRIYLYRGTSASYLDGTWLGTGTVTVSGNSYIWGTLNSNVNYYMTRITNPLALTAGARLYTRAMFYDYAGDVALTGMNYININGDTTSSNYPTYSVIFGSGLNFTGVGALTVEGSYGVQFNGKDSNFSGGLTKTGANMLWTNAGTNAVTLGAVEAGHNYLGSGNITVSNGYIYVPGSGTVTLQGSAVTVTGNGQFGVINAGHDFALVSGTIGGTGIVRFDGSLWIGDVTVLANSNFGSYGTGSGPKAMYMTAAHPSGTLTLNNFTKTESGALTLDSSVKRLQVTTLFVNNGRLILGADRQIAGTNLTLAGGVLDASDYIVDGFTNLRLTRNSTVYTGSIGQLTFSTVGTGAYWSPSAVLLLQNDGSDWLADGTGSYLRFTNASVVANLTDALLANIAFGGYEAGAKLELSGGNYYLLPNAALTNEWSGGGAGNTAWNEAANWSGGAAPNAPDASATIRDLDAALAGKAISVNGNYTIGRLTIQTSADAFTIGGSGTLTFNGSDAAVTHLNGLAPLVTTAWRLDSAVNLRANLIFSAGALRLGNRLSGAGDLTLSGVGGSYGSAALVRLSGTNAAWSGDFIWDDTVRLRVETNGTPLTGSGVWYVGGTDSAVLGTGTYFLQPSGASRSVTLAGGWALNAHFSTLQDYSLTSTQATNLFRNLTLTGPLALGSGTHVVNVDWNSAGTMPTLALTGVISGPGGIRKTGEGRLELNSTNTFADNFTWVAGDLRVNANNALGSGTFIVQGGGVNSMNIVAPAAGVHLSNPIVFNAIAYYNGLFYFDADSAVSGTSYITAGTRNITGSGTLVFGAEHAIDGPGGFQGSGVSTVWRVLSDKNTFLGGWTLGRQPGSSLEIGADSVVVGDTLVSGPIGTGTLRLHQGYLRVYSDNALVTSHTLSNTVDPDFGTFNFGVSTAAGNVGTTLVLNAPTLTLLDGNVFEFNTESGVLRLDSRLVNAASGTSGFIKTGAGVLELTNPNNQINGGIEALAGVVRAPMTGANVTVSAGAGVFGTGRWRTQTASGSGTAGAFEIAAQTVGATVTVSGSNPFILNDNGQLRVTGSNITTVLASGGYFVSTDTAGQEGAIAADLVKTTNYTLGVKMAAKNWQLDAGTVNLARANLTNSAGTITFKAGSVLNVNRNVQTLSNIVVDGNATIDVSGGVPSSPVTLTIGTVTVNAGLLTFSGWAGDIPTGKGSTILQSTLNVGTVMHGVSLAGGVEQVIVRRNIDGVSVLMPYDLSFTWDGEANNNLWTTDDWIKNGMHTPVEQPDGSTATAIFDTSAANLAGKTISLNGNRTVGTLLFTGAPKADYTINGAGNSILLDSGVSGADTFITNDGASDVTLNTDLRLVYYAPDGENLQITQNGSGHLFFNGQLSGPDSTVTVSGNGAGAVIFSGNNTFSKEFILTGGNVWLGADSVAGNGPLGGGLVTLRGGTLRGVVSGGTAGANRTLTNNYDLDGGFTLAGTNSLTLAGAGAISQDSTVNSGSGRVILGAAGKTLTVSGSQQLTTTGAVTVTGGVALSGTLETNLNSGTVTVNATVSGAGQLSKTGTGTLLLTGNNTSTGGFALAAGVTGINNSAALGTGTATLSGGTVRLDANALNLANNITAAGGTIDTQANNATLSGKIAGSGGLTKAGTGTLTVTQSNTYTGTTNITEGVVVATNADALGASPVSLTSPASPTSLVLAFNNATFDNSISGSGNLTVSGTGIRIDGATNTLTGTWHVNGSALINSATALGPNSKVNLSGTLTADGNGGLVFSNTLYGAGVLNFTNSGTTSLAGTGTNFTGTVRANGGIFDWSATTSVALTNATLETVSGTLSVGSGTQSASKLVMHGGTTQFTGTAHVTNYTISATSSVLFDLADLSAKPLLQRDEPTTDTLIVAANNWAGSLNDLRLVTADGAVLGGTSTLPVGSGTEALGVYSNTLGKSGNTLTLAYALQELKLQAGKTLALNDDTDGEGAAELHALISGAGNLEINATNAITLNTAETFTGTLTVSTGTLMAGVADVVASSTRLVVNSAFALNGYNQTVNNLSGSAAGRVFLGGNTLTMNTTTSATYAGSISGAGVVIKTGAATQTLSGSSNHSGGTRLTSGTLRMTNANALGSGTAAVAATLVTEFTGTLSNNLSGSGTVRAVSGANVTLGGNNSGLTGLLDILAGGQVTASAAANVGSARLAVGGTFVAANNAAWTLSNTLTGAGVLLKQNTANLQITQANSGFTGTASVVGGTLTLGHLQAVGTAAIADNATVQLSGLSGTLANNISGTGSVDVNSSAVTLGGNNTFSGTFKIGAGSNLTATGSASLGSGKVNLGTGGTLTLGGSGSYTLNPANTLSGSGALVKTGANTVTVSHGNSHSGTSLITGGTLVAAHAGALGQSVVSVLSDLALSFDNAAFTNTVSGGGRATVSGSGITLSGTNTAFTGTWRVTGSGTVSGTANLGAGALFLDGGVLNFTPADNASVTFGNALTGSGALVVTLGDNASRWQFASTSGATFTGTLNMRQGEYKFSTADQTGAGALKQATLLLGKVDANNVGSANIDGNYTIGSLRMDGGVLQTTLSAGNTASGTLTVTELVSAAGGGQLQVNGLDVTGLSGTVAAGQDFFADSGAAGRYQIEVVRASGAAQGTQLTLVDGNGAVIGSGSDVTRRITDGSGTAHYNYAATLGTRTADGAQGLFIGYGLTGLQANSGTQVLLSNGVTTAVLDARLTGGGGFRIEGGAAVAGIGNAASDYTGTTSVTSGTVRLTANNAFGRTVLLELAAATRVDLNDVTQSVGGLDVAANASVRVGASGALTVSAALGAGNGVNAGLLDVAGGQLNVSGNLTNSGTVLGGAASAAAVTVSGTLGNSGLMNLSERDLTAGAYTGGANSTLTVASGSIGGAATLSANATVTAGTLTVTGAIVNSGSVSTSKLTAQAAYTGSAGSALNLSGGAAQITGPLTVADGGKILLGNNGSLTASGGGALAGDGALSGSGTLRVSGNNQLLTVSGSNAVALLVTVDATDTLELTHRAALGTSGTVTTSGTLRLAGVSGAFSLDLAGGGNISATDAANVILTGSNSFSGTWHIAAGSNLKAVDAHSLGSGAVTTSGTLTLGGGGSYAVNNLITGGGAVVKEDASTVTISNSNNYTGGSVITSGTLRLQNLAALGTGTVNVAQTILSVLDLAAPGEYQNPTTGPGTVILSGSGVTITGTNNLFTGVWNITGSGTVRAEHNLGPAATALAGHLTVATTGNFAYANQLTGSGTLTASNSGGTFTFTADTGSAFAGTVELLDNHFELNNDNTAALAHATLTLGAGNKTAVIDTVSGSRALGGLIFNGGTLRLGAYDPHATRAATIVSVGALDVTASGGTVEVVMPDPALIPSGSVMGKIPLLQQDSGIVLTQLAAAATVSGNAQNIQLRDHHGHLISDAYQLNLSHDGATTDAVGTYDYGASFGADDGLYVAFVLKQVELLAGRTLILDQDDASVSGGDSFGAQLTGAGNLQINATHSITLTGAHNDYTGATTVTGGTLILGADQALGHTAQVSLASPESPASPATLDLAGHTQTIGALATAPGAVLNLNTGTLTLTADSEHHGQFTGSGLLVVDPATLTIHSASPDFTGTVHVTGSSTLLLDGPGVVTAGVVQAVGAAVIQLDSADDLVVFHTVTGTASNVTQGAGGVHLANSATITVSAPVWRHTGATTIDAGSVLITTAANVLAPDSTHTISGLLDLQGFHHQLRALDNRGTVNLAGSTGVNHLTVADLTGSGLFIMTVDYANLAHDTLTVTDSSAGSHGVLVLGQGTAARSRATFDLVHTPDGAATFTLVDSNGNTLSTVSDGKYEYALRLGDGSAELPELTDWYLTNIGLGGGGAAVLGVAGAASAGWFAQHDSLTKRLGELRLGSGPGAFRDAPAHAWDAWVRAYGEQLNVGASVSGQAFRQYLYGTDLGADKAWLLDRRNTVYTGVFGGYGKTDQSFHHGTGEGRNYYGGLYATWLHDTGWYADWIAKGGLLGHEFDAHDQGIRTHGDYHQWAAGTSLELGRKFDFAAGWYAQPLVQASYLRLFGQDYQTTDNLLDVSVGAADIIQVRAGTYLGRAIQLANASILQPYIKVAGVGQFSRGGAVTISGDNSRWRPTLDGLRAELGAGLLWQLNAQHQLHLDYEAAFGDKFDQPWGLNAGYRYQF